MGIELKEFMLDFKENYKNDVNYVENNFLNLKQMYLSLLNKIERDGKEKVIKFIEKSDFFDAPASTKYHSSIKHGLLLHSLFVYQCYLEKKTNPIWEKTLHNFTEENILIVTLLHDLCKTYFYETEWKNVKEYSDEGSRKDEKGRYDWVTTPYFACQDMYPLGHGEKSVIFLQQFMHLTMSEIMCIRWHMGAFEKTDNWMTLTNAIKLHPEIIALHEADMEASYLMEVYA